MAIEEVTYGREANDICSQTEKQRANGRCALCTDPAVYPWTNPISCFFIAPRLPFVQYPAHLFLFHSRGFASTCSVLALWFWRALWFIIAMSVRILHICWLFWRSNYSHSNVDYFSIELTVTRLQLERTRSIHEVVQNISSFMAGYLNITTSVSNFRWELKQKTRVK